MPAGCMVMVPGHRHPVQGSLSAQARVPIYKVTISGIATSGTVPATLPDGEAGTRGPNASKVCWRQRRGLDAYAYMRKL